MQLLRDLLCLLIIYPHHAVLAGSSKHRPLPIVVHREDVVVILLLLPDLFAGFGHKLEESAGATSGEEGGSRDALA